MKTVETAETVDKEIKSTKLNSVSNVQLKVSTSEVVEPSSESANVAVISEDADESGAVQDLAQINFDVTTSLSANSVLDDRYTIIAQIGEGGMATVYKAIDRQSLSDNQEVAVKILRHELARDPSVVERFHREARSVKETDHPNIVKVHDYGSTSDGQHFIVMELIEGQSLAQLLEAEKHLSVGRSINIFLQLCSALKDAHNIGIVHRDIKPSNILITRDEKDRETAKIADFGIAKPSPTERALNPALTHTGSILGSPAYMSPEQCLGGATDERSDIYALGCVMYETLTGRSPFVADTPVKAIMNHLERNPEPFEIEFKHLQIPSSLEKIVFKCLEKEPANRYQKASLLQEALTVAPASGIYRRMFAWLIDCSICMGAFCLWVGVSTQPTYSPEVNYCLTGFFFVLMSAVWAAFETSKLQATPGKLLLGLKVYSSNGVRKDFFQVFVETLSMVSIPIALTIFVVAFLALSFWLPSHFNLITGAMCFVWTWFVVLNGSPLPYNHGRQHSLDKLYGRLVAPPHYVVPNGIAPVKTNLTHTIGKTFLMLTPAILAVVILLGTLNIFAHGPSSVVIVRNAIKSGTVLKEDMLYVTHTLPFLNHKMALNDAHALVGRVMKSDLRQFSTVTEDQLEPQIEKTNHKTKKRL